MTIKEIIEKLEINKHVFESLLIHKTEQEYLWRPQPEKWNLLEIVCHLLDEEREDFRTRVRFVLENPLNKWPSINPEGWVLERDYASKSYNETLKEFLVEREKSVTWLNTQLDANWENTYSHFVFGDMSALLFLTNWLAHDYLHIRQIIRYNYNYLKETTTIDVQYAGNW